VLLTYLSPLFCFNCLGMRSIVGLAFVAFPLSVQSQTFRERPAIIEQSSDHGRAIHDQLIIVTVHLKLHDQDGFDKRVEDLYDVDSINYQRRLSPTEIASYGATTKQLVIVKKELVCCPGNTRT
jgi:hypothetical protein